MNDETNAGNTLKSLLAEREERREGKAGGPQQFLSALNEGLATLAGAPVDVVNFALRQIGIPTDPMHPFGGEALREGFRKMGAILPDEQVQRGYPHHAGRMGGYALGILSGMGPTSVARQQIGRHYPGLMGRATPTQRLAATQAAATATPRQQLRTAIAQAPHTFAGQVGQALLARPGTTTAIETGLGAMAGLGGEYAARQFGEPKRIYGELVGGFSPVVAMAAAKMPLFGWVTRKAREFGTGWADFRSPERAKARARDRVLELSENRRELERLIQEKDIFENDPELAQEMLANLSTAQRLGDDGLYRLEALIRGTEDPVTNQYPYQQELGRKAEKLEGLVSEELEILMRQIAGDSEAFGDIEQGGLIYLRNLVGERLHIGIENAKLALSKLPETSTAEEINILVRQHINKALRDIRLQENDLWTAEAINPALKVPTTESKRVASEIISNTSQAQMEDIPEAVLRYLGAKKPIPKDASAAEVRAIKKRNKALWTGEQTILEMTGLRSKLGEIAAAARNEKRWNAARIAERIRTAILDDLVYMGETQVGEIGKAFRMATDYSRHLNKTFNEGPVSKILGTSKIGDVTPESLTLESLARKEGLEAKHHIVSILNAGRSREGLSEPWNAEANIASTEKVRNNIEEFLINQFKKKVFDGDVLKGPASKNFMSRYEAVLDDPDLFPGLKTQFERSIRSGTFVRSDKVVQSILNSPKPVAELKKLLSEFPTPRQAEERRSIALALLDNIILGSSKRDSLDLGPLSKELQGADVLKKISNPKIRSLLIEGELLTTDQLKRLQRIAVIMQRVQTVPTNKLSQIIGDPVNGGYQIIAQILGAKAGSVMNRIPLGPFKGTGNIQTPGILSKQARQLASKIKDPAERLLIEAILDADKFKILMRPLAQNINGVRTQNPENVRRFNKQLETWLLAILADVDEPEYGY